MAEARTDKSYGYLFNPKYERVYRCLILIFAVVGVCAVSGLISLQTFSESLESRALVAFLFFNYLHTPLSFLGILALPELRGWFRRQFQPKRFLIFASVSVAIFAFGYFKSFQNGAPSIDRQLLTSIAVILITFHNIGQTKGLALMYNRQIREQLSAEQLSRYANTERIERWLFTLLTTVILFRGVNEVYDLQILTGNLRWIFVAAVVALILNSLRYPRVFKSGKFIFMQSLWCFVFPMFAQGAMFLQMALHGFEYVLVSEQMVQKSKFEMTRFWIVFGTGFILAFTIFGVIDAKLFKETSSILDRRILPWIVAVSVWIEFFHYYLDSQIFRFKDPYVRENVGTLLR